MNCHHCYAPISLYDMERAERISDDVKGLKCPSCGMQIYIFTFKSDLGLIKARDVKEKIFHCDKCGINTVGIPPDKNLEDRYCPICNFLFSDS